ncbi:MAG: metalloregulator ArsR/SmtB family transcription factor [Clostridia bacterium]|nr:metalloregulator ArsR/SmtB family transcription factor [Clostridia bacterium]
MGKKEMMCDCCAVHEDCLEHVKKEIVSDVDLARVGDLYKVFGDSTRLHILAALNCHEMCVCDLAVLMNMTKSAVSHQLKVLRENKLVRFSKEGKHSYYSLADDHVRDILNIALEHINE